MPLYPMLVKSQPEEISLRDQRGIKDIKLIKKADMYFKTLPPRQS